MEGTRSTDPRVAGAGWVTFAATLFIILGSFNLIDGIVAIAKDDHFFADELFFGDLTLWGLILIAFGALQLYTGWALFSGSESGVFFGLVFASLNLIAQLFFLPAYPVWSVLIMVMDVLVIYGLTVHGPRGGVR